MMIELMITSSVLILAVLLLRKVTKERISMRLRYALWLAVLLRLVIPVPVTDSALSVMNLLPESDMVVEGILQTQRSEEEEELQRAQDGGNVLVQAGAYGDSDKNTETVETGGETADQERKKGETVTASEEMTGQEQKPGYGGRAEEIAAGLAVRGYSEVFGAYRGISGILVCVWMLGTLSVSAYMIIHQVRFRRILYRRRCLVEKKKIPRELAARLTVHGIRVYQVDGLASPCLVGRNIYVDANLTQMRQKFVHVLAHEYCHAAQFDTLWAFLRSALAAVYWFHPLVWSAAFAARQDSELACDEAAIRLLGEGERFAYGRTLLYLLSGKNGRIDCAGVLTMEGRKRDVKERVHMIAQNTQNKRWVAAIVVMMLLLVCGCAFTGSEQEKDTLQGGGQGRQEGQAMEMMQEHTDRQQTVGDMSDKEFTRDGEEYEETASAIDAQEQAFLSALHYQGVMAGKDDSELALDREMDYQAYYDYVDGKQNGQEEEQKNPPENGWYLICRNEEAQISLYGLYTQEFGPRGIKTLIGEDVNTYDIAWCPSHMNGERANIRTLEDARDSLPRRFVFKILAENTSDREIWKLYSGYWYDTGTVEMEELTPQTYRDWVNENLSFEVSASGEQVLITYDGDMALAPLDISSYQDQRVEEVLLSPDVAGFQLYSDALAEEGQEGFEGVVLQLAVGLKLEGMDGVWFDGLQALNVQVLCQPEKEPAFVMQQPRIAEQSILRSLMQERRLEEIRSGNGSDLQSDETEGYLSRPLVNREEAHHDLEVDFQNPCPDYERISDGYGERVHPVTGEIRKHNGVDMAAEKGTAVVAAADGRVYETGFDAEDGNYVVLWHEQSGQMTYYTHCGEVLVSKEDQVAAGDKIATVGSSGRSTGYHLHFAVSYEGEWQEPFWGKDQSGNE